VLTRFAERFDVPSRATEAEIDQLLEAFEPFCARLGEIGFDARKTRALERTLRARALDLS
jgi:hypothetical protein